MLTIKNQLSVNSLQIVQSIPFPVRPSDQIQILPGCDKMLNTCNFKFGNTAHYGGFPYVPNPEVAQ